MKQCHIFNLTFPVEFDQNEETDPDMVDMSQLISAAEKQLRKIKKRPHKHLESFDYIESHQRE